MELTNVVSGLLMIIVPILILGAGLGFSHFIPSKKRVIGIILVAVGVVGTAFFGIALIAVSSRDSLVGSIGLGLMTVVELATLAVGIRNLRKKSSKLPLPTT
ncbi:MAG: hypothetical protein ACFCUE_10250 [Candidatus Bathyarchaeia archaeon]|jgi:hypothetical protein